MHLLVDLSANRLQRSLGNGSGEPLWFAAPIFRAEPELTFGRSAKSIVARLKSNRSCFLVFTVGSVEAMLALSSGRRRLISLHQWAPPSGKMDLKAKIRDLVLRRSRVIVTYSQIDADDLRNDYPRSKVVWIGHFVDTEFFSPEKCPPSKGDYILAVGDHKRLERVIHSVSESLGMRVIRVSSNQHVLDECRSEFGGNVDARLNVSFQELRQLYAGASFVLNAVDDTYWPVGITSFCEALAMGKPVLTSARHSCSGYDLEDRQGWICRIGNINSLDEWLAGAVKVAAAPGYDRDLRELALRHCSLTAMSKSWSDVLNLAG